MSNPTPLQQKDLISDLLYKSALRACRNQLLIFAKIVKTSLIEDGMPAVEAAENVKKGFDGYKDLSTFENEFKQNVDKVLVAYLQPNYRGRDPLGRLLVEYAFVRCSSKGIIYPQDSEQDMAACEQFIRGVLPRPIMQYFLISIRGTVDGVDNFKFLPMLFGFDDPAMDERRKVIAEVIEENKKSPVPGKTLTHWKGVYDDERSKRLMLPFMRQVMERMASLGGQRFTNILENIQRKDEAMNDEPRLKRQITGDDLDQIASALARGIKRLEEELGEASLV
ncbi:MAG: hypothetical protein D6E12_11655 [Desulfovibrio sp.]|nr:MAG: hypothetical protein D6E12_11655 [Desulfovibrio sp.]